MQDVDETGTFGYCLKQEMFHPWQYVDAELNLLKLHDLKVNLSLEKVGAIYREVELPPGCNCNGGGLY